MKKSRLGLLQTHILDILTQDELEKFEFKELPKTSTIYTEDIEIIILKTGSAKLSFFEDGEEFTIYSAYGQDIDLKTNDGTSIDGDAIAPKIREGEHVSKIRCTYRIVFSMVRKTWFIFVQ